MVKMNEEERILEVEIRDEKDRHSVLQLSVYDDLDDLEVMRSWEQSNRMNGESIDEDLPSKASGDKEAYKFYGRPN